MALLVDSSVLIGLERRHQDPRMLSRAAPDELLAVASITVSELLVGVHRADTPERRRRRQAFLESTLETLRVLPFDLPEARVHAAIWAEMAAAGALIGPHDLIIAATALANGYEVLTQNVREFERVPGLAVRQPAW